MDEKEWGWCFNSKRPDGKCRWAKQRADRLCRDNDVYRCPGWEEEEDAEIW